MTIHFKGIWDAFRINVRNKGCVYYHNASEIFKRIREHTYTPSFSPAWEALISHTQCGWDTVQLMIGLLLLAPTFWQILPFAGTLDFAEHNLIKF